MRLPVVLGSYLFRLTLLTVMACCAIMPAGAQQSHSTKPHSLTAADYQRAEKFMAYNTRPLVYHDVRAKWLAGERFWYRDASPKGFQFVIYDAARGTRQPAFDQAKLAAALSAASGTTYNAEHPPFTTLAFSRDEKSNSFQVKDEHWNCDLQENRCVAKPKPAKGEAAPPEELS